MAMINTLFLVFWKTRRREMKLEFLCYGKSSLSLFSCQIKNFVRLHKVFYAIEIIGDRE